MGNLYSRLLALNVAVTFVRLTSRRSCDGVCTVVDSSKGYEETQGLCLAYPPSGWMSDLQVDKHSCDLRRDCVSTFNDADCISTSCPILA